MIWKSKCVVLLLLCFLSCKTEKDAKKQLALDPSGLIEVATLLEHRSAPDIKIIDFRKEEAYIKGHIPNAIPLWRTDIEDTSLPYKGMMATKEQIEKLFSSLGIRPTDTLVVYDANGSCDAARLWWVLQCYGFTRVKLLNGGLIAWETANQALTKTRPKYEPSTFRLPETTIMNHHISRQQILKILTDSLPYFILDTRTTDEFTGKRQKKGAAKAGRYEGLAIPKDAEIIAYCHSGVRSAHTTFVLTQLLGYKKVKNYDGSWTEWSHFNELSFEKDSITVILQ